MKYYNNQVWREGGVLPGSKDLSPFLFLCLGLSCSLIQISPNATDLLDLKIQILTRFNVL